MHIKVWRFFSHSTEVSFLKVLGALVPTGHEAASQGRVGNDGDTQLATSFQETVCFDFQAPRRVLPLNAVDLGHLSSIFIDVSREIDRIRARDAPSSRLLTVLPRKLCGNSPLKPA